MLYIFLSNSCGFCKEFEKDNLNKIEPLNEFIVINQTNLANALTSQLNSQLNSNNYSKYNRLLDSI